MTQNTKALIGAAILIILCIIAAGYAFGAEAPSPQAQPECMSTEEMVISSMAENGVAPKVALTGDAVEPFKKFIEEARGSPLGPKTAEADHVLIFKNGDQALVVWFKNKTCMIGYGVGPWEPLAEFLGVPKDTGA